MPSTREATPSSRASSPAEPPGSGNATVSLAVVTCRRNDGLLRLLPALAEQARCAISAGYPAQILIVDNDPDGGARPVIDTFVAADEPDHPGAPVTVRYVTEPEPGISAARRCALAECGTSLLVFIDDDELPCENWLAELLATWKSTRAAAVAGPVEPDYPAHLPDWIAEGPFHQSPDFADGSQLTHAASGNLLLDLEQIRALGIRMPRMGTRGGEDVVFTSRITRAGGEIVWCRKAVVTESVPLDRLRTRWVLRRSLIDGNNDSSRRLDPAAARTVSHRLGLTASGAVRIGVGVGRAAAGLARRSPGHLGGGLHTMMRGTGMFLGAWDVVYDGYARPGSTRWKHARHSG